MVEKSRRPALRQDQRYGDQHRPDQLGAPGLLQRRDEGRADGTGFTVTGPVWEYFRVPERVFKPMLRSSPFLEGQAVELRERLIAHAMDELLREISLDQANGLTGALQKRDESFND